MKMIKTFLITGDMHGDICRYKFLENYPAETAALIVLGDVGFNYYGNGKDMLTKAGASMWGNYIYCVRGNHEMRPDEVPTMEKYFDDNVGNFVYYEPEFPYIRYFIDGYLYNIDDYRTLVIGGAYSVDKPYRISRGMKWFQREQLTPEEMDNIYNTYKGDAVDIILSHTCPLSWQPTDLFLDFIDQSSVDNSMEVWMDKIKEDIKYNLWLFGHYHRDRLVRPHVEMLLSDVQKLDDVYNRWNDADGIIPLYWEFDPKFKNLDNPWIEKEKDRWT